MNLQAEIFLAKGEWQSAIARLTEVLAISEEIGDTGLAAAAHAKLARASLETGQTDQAELQINRNLALRPADAEVLKLQAQLAASRDQPNEALEFMTAARSSAGEAWQEADDQVLQSYQEAVAATALR